MTPEVASAVFEEFAAWLTKEVRGLPRGGTQDLAKRVVALVAVSEGFAFAMQHAFPPLFPQSKFVLVLSTSGEVRVMWVAFATPEPKPDLTCTPYIVKLATRNLNTQDVADKASQKGVLMDYVAVHAIDTDLDGYVRKREASGLRSAVDSDCWDDLLGTV